MTRYIVANWKSHKTMPEAEKWIKTFCRDYNPDPQVEVIIAPPSVYLFPLAQILKKYDAGHIMLAVQDISPFPQGAYTGTLAADMVRDIVGYAIVGHSERRRYFHEINQEIANKVTESVSSNIKPIVCVDQPYARSQIAALDDADLDDLIIGYGPVEAVGIETPQPIDKVRDVVVEIQSIVPEAPILYGGSINEEYAGSYLEIEGVAGLMVGTACLDPDVFGRICMKLGGFN